METDLPLPDGRTLHVYDTGSGTPVFWHHGTPQIGAVPTPLLALQGIRWLSYDRPGYGGSTDSPGRTVGSAAADIAAIADSLGVTRFSVLGHSGGANHALACAALLPDRVTRCVSAAALAPFEPTDLDWWAGMVAPEELRASVVGREALAAQLAEGLFDENSFTAADHAAVSGGAWSDLGRNSDLATANGLGGMIDDDLAYVVPWGFSVEDIRCPTLLLHGVEDRVIPFSHGGWLAKHIPGATLRPSPSDGHISVLDRILDVVEWLHD
ncbi:alpha/beta fold hydrolase [Kutzneria buriramensis]|uniref:Pimeloyl-ACP methyl ester carboxylesterase n=1 Tax=Kutzneria buriramensis TaxID=1045776 RepID=A0A3E0HG72_9PSEU|nr:alpha/beta hydrolase [Kutzneria buriramensis]REH44815.1 pimeloyl-ACP methyl ester carboxylesterase [Kutzneria buriramensis]